MSWLAHGSTPGSARQPAGSTAAGRASRVQYQGHVRDRQAGHQIDREPAVQVVVPDLVVLNDELVILVAKRGAEVEEDVSDEVDVCSAATVSVRRERERERERERARKPSSRPPWHSPMTTSIQNQEVFGGTSMPNEMR